jgi:hypothetical protein
MCRVVFLHHSFTNLHVPDGHLGCKMPVPLQVLRSVGHLDAGQGHSIRLHLGKAHTPTCTPNKNYQPTVPSVQLAPLIMGRQQAT